MENIDYDKLEEITVRSQEELDSIPDDFEGTIYIMFGEAIYKAVLKDKQASAIACNNSCVLALGNSRVIAQDNSHVKCYDNSYIEAHDHCYVEVHDNCKAKGLGNSRIKTYDKSSVKAYENSRVNAYGKSSVEAHDNCMVEAWDDSRIKTCGSQIVVCDNRVRISVKNIGIEIIGTRERLEELVNCISFENETPSSALADLVSELEMALDIK